jgi:hypothetical protein
MLRLEKWTIPFSDIDQITFFCGQALIFDISKSDEDSLYNGQPSFDYIPTFSKVCIIRCLVYTSDNTLKLKLLEENYFVNCVDLAP